MGRWIATVLLAVITLTGTASAQQSQQDLVWVQIEAHPTLREAQERAAAYAARLPDVMGFFLGGGWYGIALGPYVRSDANQVLRVYRAERQIPSDSYIVNASSFRQQFWPKGDDILNRGTVTAPAQPQVAAPQVTTPPEPSDETPSQARRSERLLTAAERRDLQTALKAAGFYAAAIDGAFGAGTRRSMADWQAANGYETTGILTTAQRRVLMEQYNAPLISVGLETRRNLDTGIEIALPLEEVQFARLEPPFAHFDASGDLGARVLLISQPGTQATLTGLYDIMQTLEIVPLEGPRNRSGDRFTLEGRNGQIVSYTEAALVDGEIKGFTLIWPADDEARRLRVLAAMRDSFVRVPGVLDPGAGAEAQQNIDLISGLQVRKPRLSRSGFYVDRTGNVVTASEVVRGCTRITLDETYDAQVITSDDGLGVAILRPTVALAPMSVAGFAAERPRLRSEIAVAGYSFEGVLGAPTLTFGKLEDTKGLRGETELNRLALAPLPGDAGGPVLDAGGGLVGMLLPPQPGARQLPNDVSFAADAQAIRNVLDVAGLNASERPAGAALDPEDLNRLATGMTVLVSCWE